MKTFWIALAILILIAAAAYAFMNRAGDDGAGTLPPAPQNSAPQVTKHSDPMVGLEFEYRENPDGYILQTAGGTMPNYVKTYTLMLKSDQADLPNRQNGEGPPVISIQIYRNPLKLTPRAWAEANVNASNLNLIMGSANEAAVGGAQAIRYRADGLYLSDNAVVTQGDFVYVISGQYQDENSTIRRDFEPFLSSIKFI